MLVPQKSSLACLFTYLALLVSFLSCFGFCSRLAAVVLKHHLLLANRIAFTLPCLIPGVKIVRTTLPECLLLGQLIVPTIHTSTDYEVATWSKSRYLSTRIDAFDLSALFIEKQIEAQMFTKNFCGHPRECETTDEC